MVGMCQMEMESKVQLTLTWTLAGYRLLNETARWPKNAVRDHTTGQRILQKRFNGMHDERQDAKMYSYWNESERKCGNMLIMKVTGIMVLIFGKLNDRIGI